ncbi:hypothetical protein [Burkholderia sp. MSMB1459WGS]|uniref:hypothetical protein n=1 Tax=Burkholderia sp. MSMB1459WGS TaxID=1637970 RepID=UPI000B18F264|nr:hypothetical protein [Burkholderia sp. MSMB1459WGS]
MPDTLDTHRECTIDSPRMPVGTMRDGDRRLSIHGSRHRLPGGDMAHDASRIRTRAPRRTRRRATSNLIRKSVARTRNGRTPARIAGGLSSFIQAAKGAILSPGLRHAPPDR